MVNAIILVNTRHDRINAVAEQLAELPGVSETYSVGGSFDVVAIVRVRSNEEIAQLVTERMGGIEGIERTQTLIAFQAYSRHDLEAVFSIGIG